MTSARAVAAHVLRRVWQAEAYAAAALDAELRRAQLDARDRALATELTYGVLRTEAYLRRCLERYGRLERSEIPTIAHLLVGAYQIAFLDRVPAHAAVSEAVGLVRGSAGARSAGFANAVLRRFADDSRETEHDFQEAVLASTPSWLRKRLYRDVGRDEALALLVPAEAPRPTVRFRPGVEPAPRGFRSVSGAGGAAVWEGGGDPRELAAHQRGDFVVQELGAQYVARAVGVRDGERVLDVCCGRGQKTSVLCDSGAGVRVVASDVHEHKLSQLSSEMNRLGLHVETILHDWTEAPPEHLRGAFDAVLVDAPCTGVGTLRRRPEIARRLSPDDPGRMADLQVSIVRQAIRCLAPGGRLVLATCSVLREECEGLVERIAEEATPLPFAPEVLPPNGRDGVPAFRLLPLADGTDGYFVAQVRGGRAK